MKDEERFFMKQTTYKETLPAPEEFTATVKTYQETEKNNQFSACIIEHLAEGIAVATSDGILLFVNTAWARMHGYENPEALIGRSFKIFHTRDQLKTEVLPFNEEVLRKGRHAAEICHKRRDGTLFPAEMNVSMMKDKGDKGDSRTLLVASMKDITERKGAEKALQESKDKFKGILERSPDGILTIDMQGIVDYVSPATQRISGYPAEDVVGKHFSAFFSNEDMAATSNAFGNVLQGTSGAGLEVESKDINGNTICLEFNAIPIISHEEITGVQVIFRDISERKRIKEELGEDELKYRLLSENQLNIVATMSLEGKITYCSPAIKKFGGYEIEEVLEHSFTKFLCNKTDISRAFKALDLLVAEGKTVTGDYMFKTKNSEPFPVEVTANPISVAGQVAAIQIVIRDITEKKRLEKEIVEISEREKQQVGFDLHDGLGQLLTGISFMSKRLEDDLTEKVIDEAVDAAKITALIGQSIAQARDLAKGLYPVTLSNGNLIDALEQLASDMEAMCLIKCRLEYDHSLTIHNRSQMIHLYRIVQEAMNNAVRHGKAKQITITLTKEDDRIKLIVEDDGTGIAPVPDKSKGMGLKIMDYRARMINAVFSVKPNNGKGTIVTCIFGNSDQAPPDQGQC